MKSTLVLAAVLFSAAVSGAADSPSASAADMNARFHGVLRLNPANPNYFTDDSGKAVYLTGSHTWQVLQDINPDPSIHFDYDEYLGMMTQYHHNFIRFWYFEQALRGSWTLDQVHFSPLPYQRTGPGVAGDGQPKFNLDRWNQPFFDRLRARLIEAGRRGIYVSVMLFNGFSLNKAAESPLSDPWVSTPYNPANNTSGIGARDATIDDDANAAVHTLKNPELLKVEERYVRKTIETVNDLDNVLYEIVNEGGATDWQYHMVDFVHEVERALPKQHPVGMNHRITGGFLNADLYRSHAEWICPAVEPQGWVVPGSVILEDYKGNPPVNKTGKVIVSDTDHLWGHGGNAKWVWKSFTRGLNPIFMDPWGTLGGKIDPKNAPWMFIAGGICKDFRDYPDWDPVRRNMGYTRDLADRVDLVAMRPQPELSSTGYCLANPGKEYIIYFPEEGTATLNLVQGPGEYAVEWFIPSLNRKLVGAGALKGGAYVVLEPPFTGDAVLYLKRR
jgi:hypothetical protein